jgi:hypothetical protein
MVFHHERQTIEGVIKTLTLHDVNAFMVDRVRSYLTDSEFEIYRDGFTAEIYHKVLSEI